jgi:nucleotide-binding universal stress UspA family protein
MATSQLIALPAAGVGIHNVLIAADFSRQSHDVINAGMDLSRAYGAHALILYVLPRDEFILAGFEAYAAGRDAARRDLLELERALHARYSRDEGRNYELVMSEGDVADAILDCAREKQADLIVIGTHGRSGLSKMLLGSVAERVFRHSDIPVLTIGPSAHRITALAPSRILVPVDFTPASLISVKYACELACEHRAELALLHVLEHPDTAALADMDRLKSDVEGRLGEVVEAQMDRSRVKLITRVGKVVPIVLSVAWELNADLMVLGVHRYTGLVNRLRWQVAYDLVRQAPSPVLTVREHNGLR